MASATLVPDTNAVNLLLVVVLQERLSHDSSRSKCAALSPIPLPRMVEWTDRLRTRTPVTPKIHTADGCGRVLSTNSASGDNDIDASCSVLMDLG